MRGQALSTVEPFKDRDHYAKRMDPQVKLAGDGSGEAESRVKSTGNRCSAALSASMGGALSLSPLNHQRS
jgi:hypothetical protein